MMLLLVVVGLLVCVNTVQGLSCYACHSAEAGCGKELNIRLERWQSCPKPTVGSRENFCVKLIEKKGSEEYITRGCLETFRRDTLHRQRIPMVQRHGYCEPARNNDPWNPVNKNIVYCFCNDWNGCNGSSVIRSSFGCTLLFGLITSAVLYLLS